AGRPAGGPAGGLHLVGAGAGRHPRAGQSVQVQQPQPQQNQSDAVFAAPHRAHPAGQRTPDAGSLQLHAGGTGGAADPGLVADARRHHHRSARTAARPADRAARSARVPPYRRHGPCRQSGCAGRRCAGCGGTGRDAMSGRLPYAWARTWRALLETGIGGPTLTVSARTPAWALAEIRRVHGAVETREVADAELDTLLAAAYAHAGDAAAIVDEAA